MLQIESLYREPGPYKINIMKWAPIYESIATVGEIRVWWRADFQSGSRVLKKGVLNLFLSISMAYNVISCQKVAENTQILKIAKFAM